MKVDEMTPETQQALEAAAFRRLLQHLSKRPDVQNIELMNLAGFCRNCLSKWYLAAAEDQQLALDYEDVRSHVYGMPYEQWKQTNQTAAKPDELAAFNSNKPQN
jgi:uncharacterized protein